MRILLCFFFISILSTFTAQATPSRTLTMHDRPVAFTPTHLFLIRTVEDNIGFYQTNLVHRFLIRQNFKSGAVEQHWPLRHLLVTDDYVNQDDGPKHTIDLYEPPQTNADWHRYRPKVPFKFVNADAILRKAKAVPLSPFNIDRAHNRQMSWDVTATHGLVKGVPKQAFADERGFYSVERMSLLKPGTSEPDKLPADAEVLVKPDALKATIVKTILPTLHWLRDAEAKTEDKTNTMSWSQDGMASELSYCEIRDHISVPMTKGPEMVSLDCEEDSDVSRFRIWIAAGFAKEH